MTFLYWSVVLVAIGTNSIKTVWTYELYFESFKGALWGLYQCERQETLFTVEPFMHKE